MTGIIFTLIDGFLSMADKQAVCFLVSSYECKVAIADGRIWENQEVRYMYIDYTYSNLSSASFCLRFASSTFWVNFLFSATFSYNATN